MKRNEMGKPKPNWKKIREVLKEDPDWRSGDYLRNKEAVLAGETYRSRKPSTWRRGKSTATYGRGSF